MPNRNILLVEDEEHLRELVRYHLTEDGFEVTDVGSAEEALDKLAERLPDLIVLDLMLPKMDGLEVCRRLKSDPMKRGIPILMLTAKGSEADMVTGIEMGADDYVAKPFSPRVLSARVKMILRRRIETPRSASQALKLRGLTLQPVERQVLVKGRPVSLTSTEYRLLDTLCRNAGSVLTRQQLVQAVHDDENPVSDRSVDVQMFGLRKKLGSFAGRYIESVRGVGYRIKP